MNLYLPTDLLIGDTVPIYKDPITCIKEEGKATILQFIDSVDEEIHLCKVKFKNGKVANRLIRGNKF